MQGDFNTSLETSGKVTTELTFPKETENFMTWLAENPKLSQHGLTPSLTLIVSLSKRS